MRKFSSVSWKFLGVLIPSISIAAAIILALYSYGRFVYAERLAHEKVENYLDVHADAIAYPLWTLDYGSLQRNIKTLAAYDELMCVEVFEKVGSVEKSLFDWPENCSQLTTEMFSLTRAVVSNNETLGKIRVLYSKLYLLETVRREVIAGALFFFALASVAAIAAYGALRYIVVGPLGQLISSIHKAEQQNILEPVGHGSQDELGRVIHAYNKMIRQVDERTDELVAAREDAESLAEAKSRFLATMSHELRTPLSAVIGITEMLREDVEDEGSDTEPYERIAGSSRHLLSLIEDILDYSRLEAGKIALSIETIDLNGVINEIHATALLLAKNNQNSFSVVSPSHSIWLNTDSVRLRQILLNLLGNAFKFTQNGSVTLEVSVLEGEPDIPASLQEMPRVQFTVKDTGIGITEDQREHLFEEFSQADESTTRKFGGAGLGLAIAQGLCNRLGGHIELGSEPGVGSEFSFSIPVNLPMHTSLPAVASGSVAEFDTVG